MTRVSARAHKDIVVVFIFALADTTFILRFNYVTHLGPGPFIAGVFNILKFNDMPLSAVIFYVFLDPPSFNHLIRSCQQLYALDSDQIYLGISGS